jgi:hypothetical protein
MGIGASLMPGKSHARKESRIKTKHREAIQTSMIRKRLETHIVDDCMSASQVTAALGLLKKTIPDLKATEITGADGTELFPTDVNVHAVGPEKDS